MWNRSWTKIRNKRCLIPKISLWRTSQFDTKHLFVVMSYTAGIQICYYLSEKGSSTTEFETKHSQVSFNSVTAQWIKESVRLTIQSIQQATGADTRRQNKAK